MSWSLSSCELFEFCRRRGCDALHLLLGDFRALLAEVKVALGLERNEVDVGVGHFHAQHGHAYALAGDRGLESRGDRAREVPQAAVGGFVEVEYVVVFDVFRYHQSVSGRKRADVEEGVVVFILGNLV